MYSFIKQDMSFVKKSISLTVMCLAITWFPSVSGLSAGNDELAKQYFHLKASGKYNEAVNLLTTWTMRSTDTVTVEANIYRIRELCVFPELYSLALRSLKEIRAAPQISDNPLLRSRLFELLVDISQKSGNTPEASHHSKVLSYSDFYLIGPFRNNSDNDFDTYNRIETTAIHRKSYKGKFSYVSWFPVKPGLDGAVRIDELFNRTENSFYYLKKNFLTSEDGVYRVILGKSGYTDLWLDGKKIFSNRKQHPYHPGQYVITISLAAGHHTLLVKTGSARNDTALSLRLSDRAGKPVSPGSSEFNSMTETWKKKKDVKVLNVSLFPSMEYLFTNKNRSDRNHFLSGYLSYSTGIGLGKNNQSIEEFSRIKETSVYYEPAQYYSGLISTKPEIKDRFYTKAFNHRKKNMEAISEKIRLKIKHGFFYEADELLQKMKKISRLGGIDTYLEARLYLKRKWNFEALQLSRDLKKSPYPSLGYKISSRVHLSMNNHSEAVEDLEYIYKIDPRDRKYHGMYIKALRKSGRAQRAMDILHEIGIHEQNRIAVKLQMAEIAEHSFGIKAALPYLSSALRLSPGNTATLEAIGRLYLRMNKIESALYYLRQALAGNPDNIKLKQYLNLITPDKMKIVPFLNREGTRDLEKKADTYKSEPAVILLNEILLTVRESGSYEKTINKAVKIYKKAAVQDFNRLKICYDPDKEKLEGFECSISNGNNRIDLTEYFIQTISQSSGRSVYGIKSLILQVPSLQEGSVLRLKYTMKGIPNPGYRNCLGEKFLIGGKYRTIKTNIVVHHDNKSDIYCHVRGLPQSWCNKIRDGSSTIYHVTSHNTEPVRIESFMPDLHEIVPRVYFVSHENWNQLYTWYKNLIREKSALSVKMKKILKDIIDREDTPEERIQKIYHHVTDSIRYIDYEFSTTAHQPRGPDATYHAGMGDCMDMSMVLLSFLGEAGLNANLALVRTKDRGLADLTVPYIGEFNHVIVHVSDSEEKVSMFLDPSASYSGYRELPWSDTDVMAFIIGKKSYNFIKTTPYPGIRDTVRIRNSLTINENGTTSVKRTVLKTGCPAAALRKDMEKPEKKIRSLALYWKKIFPESEINTLSILEKNRERAPCYNYTLTIPSFVEGVEDKRIINPFLEKTGYFTSYAAKKKRSYPLVIKNGADLHVTTVIKFPRDFSISHLPKDEKFSHEKFYARFTFRAFDRAVNITRTIRLATDRIPVTDYEDFTDFAMFINRKESESILLERKDGNK